MPRDGSGNYTLPAGNPVVPFTVIESTWANPTMADIALQLNNVLTRDGSLGPLSPFRVPDGNVSLPSLSFISENTTGFWRPGVGALNLSLLGGLTANFQSGILSLTATTTEGGFLANSNSASAAAVYRLNRGGLAVANYRWVMYRNSIAESGANAGSDFAIASYNDAGAFLANSLSITRSNSLATFAGSIATTGIVTAGGVSIRSPAINTEVSLTYTNVGSLRWYTGKNSAAESGANAGSDWFLASCNDAGAFLAVPIGVNRATGVVTLSAVMNGTSALTNGLTATALNTSYNWTNTQNFVTGAAGVGSAGQAGVLGVYSLSSNPAVMHFHRAGVFAINMGLDTDNVFRLGGWSDGAGNYRYVVDSGGNFFARNIAGAGGSFFGSIGAIRLIAGSASQSGYVDFVAANGNRQGYIGLSFDTGASDTGTIRYVAGLHNFFGPINGNNSGPLVNTQSGTAPNYVARAWGNVTGGGVLNQGGNIASVVRNSAGVYTVTFTTAMPNANYAVVATSIEATNNLKAICVSAVAAGSFVVRTTNSGSSAADYAFMFQVVSS